MILILDFIDDAFKIYLQYIEDLFNILVGWFEDILEVQSLVVSVISNIPSYFTWLPNEILSALILLLGIVVLYKVLGRT